MNEIITDGMRSIEAQYDECRQWATWLRFAGYDVNFSYTGQPEPFDREWQVWTAGDNTQRIATIDIDGCGASWHGPDDLWTKVIGSKVDMI